MKTKTILFIVAVVFSGSTLLAQTAKVGLAGAQFLKVPIGGRAGALDAATIPLTDDIASIFSNPAGLNHLQGTGGVFLSHVAWFADIQLNAGAIVYSVGGVGKVGAFFAQMNSGDIPVTTEFDQTGSSGETFAAVSTVVGVSYAKMFTDKFGIGLNVKWVQEDLVKGYASGDYGKGGTPAIDIGTWYDTGVKGVRFSAVVQNFGGEITPAGTFYDFSYGDTIMTSVPGDVYGTKEQVPQEFHFRPYSLPMTFNFGIAFNPMSNLTMAITLVQPNDNLQRYIVGAEYSVLGILKLRGSYGIGRYQFMTGWDEDGNAVYEKTLLGFDDQVFAGGVGFHFKNLELDVAYRQFNLLDSVYNGSISITF